MVAFILPICRVLSNDSLLIARELYTIDVVTSPPFIYTAYAGVGA